MDKQQALGMIRNIPDFPQKGIQFKDITTLIKDPEGLKWASEEIAKQYKGKAITKVLGIESRGFILGTSIAIEIGAGFVPIRKPGKLPAKVIEQTYQKEYGTDTIEIHEDALSADDVVMIHDDLLATGGTLEAAVKLAKRAGVQKIYVSCIIELEALEGRKQIDEEIEIFSLLKI